MSRLRLPAVLCALSVCLAVPAWSQTFGPRRGTPPIEKYDPNARLTRRDAANSLVCETQPNGFGVSNRGTQVVPAGTRFDYTVNESDQVAGSYTTRADLDVGAFEAIRAGRPPRSCRVKP